MEFRRRKPCGQVGVTQEGNPGEARDTRIHQQTKEFLRRKGRIVMTGSFVFLLGDNCLHWFQEFLKHRGVLVGFSRCSLHRKHLFFESADRHKDEYFVNNILGIHEDMQELFRSLLL
jgi:hypothetical protein